MKRTFLVFMLMVSGSLIQAQVPGFEQVFRWNYGPVTTIEGNEDAVFFTCGSLLVTGDISVKDTLLEIAKLDLGESVTSSYLSGDRLYLMGSSFFIINISNRYQPMLISKTPVSAGHEQDIRVLGSVAFLNINGILSVYDISDETHPKYSTRVPGYVNSFALAGGQLCFLIGKTIYIADLQNPLQPVVSDSIQLKQKAYSFCLAGKDNHLFVGSSEYKNKMLVYSNSENSKFGLTDSLDLGQGGEFVKIKGQILGYFELGWGGYGFILVDISDIKNPIEINSQNPYFFGSSFWMGNNNLISTDGSFGLTYYSKVSDSVFKWKFSTREAGNMTKPVIKGNEIYIPEYSGYKYFAVDQSGNAVLKRSAYLGTSDVIGESLNALDGQGDYLFAAYSDNFGVISKSNNPVFENWHQTSADFETISKLRVQDTILVILLSKDKWSTDGHSFVHLINVKNPKNPSDIGSFITQAVISDFYVDSNRIFLACPDSGILRYTYPWTGWVSGSSEGSFGKEDKPGSLIKQKNIFALNSEKKVTLYRETAENQFQKISEINPGALVGSSAFIDHYLLIQTTKNAFENIPYLPIAVYNISNPESPVFAGYFESALKNTGISADGNKVIVTHGDRGFTLYSYKSGPDGVEDPTETSPHSFSLKPAYPNPFNPETRIPFTLPDAGTVTFEVYSVLGQKVNSVSVTAEAGLNSVGLTLDGQASGMYLVKGIWQGRQVTQRILLVK